MHTYGLQDGSGLAFVDGSQTEGLFYIKARREGVPAEALDAEGGLAEENRLEIVMDVDHLRGLVKGWDEKSNEDWVSVRGPTDASRSDVEVEKWASNPSSEEGLTMGTVVISVGEARDMVAWALSNRLEQKMDRLRRDGNLRQVLKLLEASLAL